MARVQVPFDRYFAELCHCLGHGGALVVSLNPEGRPNAMTIGWAQVGVIWGKPICTVLIRPSRYTYVCCNATGDFTVNVPYASLAEAVLFCGTKSGRNVDKFSHCGFTAAPALAQGIASPYIAECGLAYECKTVFFNEVLPEHLSSDIADSAYPTGNYHRLYFGEILSSHADPDFMDRFYAP